MKRRFLGDSGLEVSAVALGTWAMGGSIETWGPVDDGESIAAIHQALDCGINLIDTAPVYGLGHSEQIVGNAIQGRRGEVLLATKCGLPIASTRNGYPPRCLAPASILRECEQSLRRLRTDVIDLYLCHWPDPDTPILDTMEALVGLREQGKIRAIGLSNFSCEQVAAAREFGTIHCLQSPFSMVARRTAEDLVPFCREHGMGVLAYSPLAKGLLTGKFREKDTFDGVRARDPDFIGKRYLRNLRMLESLRPIAEAYDKTLTQLVINWTASQPGITAPVVGAKRASQVLENAGGVGWSIRDEDRLRIDRILQDAQGES